MKPCPLCAELNFDDALNCRWCNASLSETPDLQSPTVAEGTSGKATASLICGIFFFFWPVAVVAIILGHIARGEIRRSGGRLKGAGTAMAGLVLGYIGVAIIPVILIIAAIAIPSLMRAKRAANEASAVGSLRVLNTACASFADTYGVGFPRKLANLRPASTPSQEAADLIDSVLASGQKTGYAFRYVPGPEVNGVIATYSITAEPVPKNTSGGRHFFTDQSGVIRVESENSATAESPPLG